jgi:LysM repeat protein
MAVHIVERGDTLYAISRQYGVTVADLVKWNDIPNPNLLAVGDHINLGPEDPDTGGGTGGGGGTGSGDTGGGSSGAPDSGGLAILQFGLLSTSDNTLFATWKWDRSNTKSYQVKWEYTVKDWPDTWFVGDSSEKTIDKNDPHAARQSTYMFDSKATKVRFSVKPISETYDNNGKESVYWSAGWSTRKVYYVTEKPPTVPSVPSIELTGDVLLTKLENLDLNATAIHFQVLKRSETRFNQFKRSNTTIQYISDSDAANRVNGYARYSCYVDPDGEYKVRARSARGELYSEWSDYSESVYSAPTPPAAITEIRASSETSVYLAWELVDTAESYDIQYTTELDNFEGSNDLTTENGITGTNFKITGLESGEEYFFRVRAVRGGVQSEWTEPVSVIVGKKPGIPTTWSSSTTVVTGEPLTLYWIHNSEDGSSQTEAELELTIGGTIETLTIPNMAPEDDRDRTSAYEFDTSGLAYGSTILWRVRTKGIHESYSDWSIQRTVEIYAPPSLTLSVTDYDGNDIDSLTALPMSVKAVAGPIPQRPIGYHLTIVANESYDTVDGSGDFKMVMKGEEVFSRHYDITESLEIELSAGDVSLENNVSYTLMCSATMNSGLVAENSVDFTTAWGSDAYWPNAEVLIDKTSLIATIRPYCMTVDNNYVADHTLAVYRRNFDGSLTKLMDGIVNDGGTHITDPHPALDYARYRIVATSTVTGRVSYYDMPGIKVGGNAIVLQWDEAWSAFDNPEQHVPVEPSWVGSMLQLPYNIDIREDAKPDVAHVQYIGREHPVPYHGTQIGETAVWSTVIDKKDVETLYALRRLARWRGNVYVREPSGSGYWATVIVSLDQKHKDLVIPITIDVTRVEGGV